MCIASFVLCMLWYALGSGPLKINVLFQWLPTLPIIWNNTKCCFFSFLLLLLPVSRWISTLWYQWSVFENISQDTKHQPHLRSTGVVSVPPERERLWHCLWKVLSLWVPALGPYAHQSVPCPQSWLMISHPLGVSCAHRSRRHVSSYQKLAVAAPPFGWSPHPRRLCSISWNSANTSFTMPSALTGIQRRARVALFSEALPPSPSSQDAQELKVFTFLSCPLVEERTQCAKCRVCDIYEQWL